MATKKAKAEVRLFTLQDEDCNDIAVNLTWKQVQDKIMELLTVFLKREAKDFFAAALRSVDMTKADSEEAAGDTCPDDWSEGICTEIFVADQIVFPNFTIIEQCKLPERKVKFVSFRK